MRVQIAFYHGNKTLFDKAIAWWQKVRGEKYWRYTHVEIVINGVWVSSSPRDGGVRIGHISVNLNNWDIVNLSNNKALCNRLMQLAEQEKGKKYDWLGIFLAQLIPLHIQNRSRWFCSELCGMMLHTTNLVQLTKGFSTYSPAKLARNF